MGMPPDQLQARVTAELGPEGAAAFLLHTSGASVSPVGLQRSGSRRAGQSESASALAPVAGAGGGRMSSELTTLTSSGTASTTSTQLHQQQRSSDTSRLPDVDKKDLTRIELGLAKFKGLKSPDDLAAAVYHVDLQALGKAGDDGVTLLKELVALPSSLLPAFQVLSCLSLCRVPR
jgi:hypothetical protein